MSFEADASAAKAAYQSTRRFASGVVLLGAGFLIIGGAALVIALSAAYLQDGGLIARGFAAVLRVLAYGLLIVDVVWFVVMMVRQAWRFVLDVRARRNA